MKLFILSLAPLSPDLTHAPRPLRAIPEFLQRGHTVYLAAPPVGDADALRAALGVQALLPLYRTAATDWARLLLNSYRVAVWAQRWKPQLYLSLGARSATLAHGGRGAVGGYGLSVLVLPALRFQSGSRIGRILERRAIHECDRLITYEASLGDYLVARYGTRGGDLTLLPGVETSPFVAACENYLTEPPGFYP